MWTFWSHGYSNMSGLGYNLVKVVLCQISKETYRLELYVPSILEEGAARPEEALLKDLPYGQIELCCNREWKKKSGDAVDFARGCCRIQKIVGRAWQYASELAWSSPITTTFTNARRNCTNSTTTPSHSLSPLSPPKIPL